MRRALLSLTASAFAALAMSAFADAAWAQTSPTGDPDSQIDRMRRDRDEDEDVRLAPLRRRAAIGPCPYVKILYDAARYVETGEGRLTAQNVGYTGEIEALTSDCGYQDDEPIQVDMRMLFNLGRGPLAQGDQKTYRYWVAVTERNRAILAKEYFDLPVTFDGERTTSVIQEQSILIPRAEDTTSGGNFEILVGFEVTPQMAELNATGSRFRVNAGAPEAAATPPVQ